MWCIAELTPDYITKMEAVLAVYERPYAVREPVVCLDEKPISLHAEVHLPRPAQPGHVAKRDSEYRRGGTANVFAIVEPKLGRHFTGATPNRSGHQFACIVRRLVAAYPCAKTIHVVMDNLTIHCGARNRSPMPSASERDTALGDGFPCISRRNMAVGSIKPNSSSAW